jgi:hypothetical protein
MAGEATTALDPAPMVTDATERLHSSGLIVTARLPTHRVLLGTISFLTVLLVVIIPSASVGARLPASIKIALPVISCPTTYVSPPSSGSQAAKVTVGLPRSISHNFSLYSDSKRTLAPLLAPKGWHCTAEVDEDGSVSLNVYPAKTPLTPTGFDKAQQVTATSDGACQGCIAAAVCPYFENAPSQLGFSGMNCTTTKPNDEQERFLNGSNTSNHGTVDTYDPSTKSNKYPISGVLRYSDTTGEGVDAREDCFLPKARRSWCQAILNEFIAKNWEFQPTASPQASTTTSTVSASPVARLSRRRPESSGFQQRRLPKKPFASGVDR